MAEIKRLIAETERDLAAARSAASPPGHPRRFLEFDALIARVRLQALARRVDKPCEMHDKRSSLW